MLLFVVKLEFPVIEEGFNTKFLDPSLPRAFILKPLFLMGY